MTSSPILWSDDDDDIICIEDTTDTIKSKKTNSNKKTLSKLAVGASCKKSKSFPRKSSSQWVSSAFDGFDDFGISTQQTNSSAKSNNDLSIKENQTFGSKTRKRPREVASSHQKKITHHSTVTRKNVVDNELWAEKHVPVLQGELAVHKKKIAEVEDWLRQNLHRKSAKGGRILLLTGPSGAGKTATVKVLAMEMNAEIQEWVNPITESYTGERTAFNREDFVRVEGFASESQTKIFSDFLLRANKYNTLDIFGAGNTQKKIILVEDLPNVFFRNTRDFHDILRHYVSTGHCPLIFIVSDSAGGESSERVLFPKDVQMQLGIDNISFNPVAVTSITKVLSRIAQTEASQGAHRFSVPDKSTLDAIANACSGDIRGAVNALQFACLKDTHDLTSVMTTKSTASLSKSSKKSSKHKDFAGKLSSKQKKLTSGDEERDLAAIGGKDTTLFLFRALGKILYCKRSEPDENSDLKPLPSHLSHHYRDPMLVNPEDVVEKSHLSGDYFNAYLQQNYLEFFNDLEDVVRASEYLSDADYLTSDWMFRASQKEYSSCVATRGLMHSNSARAYSSSKTSGLGWKPLHKPQWFTAVKKARENCSSARVLFQGHCWTPEDLQTQFLPYLYKTTVPLRNPGQFSFLQEICEFSKMQSHRNFPEKLDEKDVENDEDELATQTFAPSKQTSLDADDIPNSQNNIQTSEADDTEDIVIEDFDD